jgi:hypothetical protein
MNKKFAIAAMVALLNANPLFAARSELPKIDFSGYIDTSYNYLSRKNVFTSGVFDRSNDVEPNGFTLQQVAFTVASLPPEGIGGLLHIIAGRDANTLSPAGWDPYFGSQTLSMEPEQFFMQYGISSFTLMGGKLPTLAGYETNNPAQNANFSFSVLSSFAEPSAHIGLRGNYAVNKTLNYSVGINNGWDTLHHASRLQTFELGSQWQPHAILSTSISFYSGKEYLTDTLSNGPVGIRNYANFFATLKPNQKLNFTINIDYGIQSKGLSATQGASGVAWSGVTGYINYYLTERWYTTVRGDLFDDSDGYRTGVRQCLKALTLTLGFKPFKQLTLRAETRHDFSNQNSFVNNNSVSASNNLQSFSLEGLYTFSY